MARRSAPSPRPSAVPSVGRLFTVAALLLGLLVFAAVRWATLFNDLWLDEIWSLHLLRELQSPGEILTRLHHDNNHPLNSFFLSVLMPASADWHYRLLSWTTGVATVLLGGLAVAAQTRQLAPAGSAARLASVGAAIGVILCGGCYLLVHYSSEARGYAPAVCFGIAAMAALLHGSERPGWRWPVVYWSICALGLLSHATFVQVMAGATVWTLLAASVESTARSRWRRLAVWHGVPWVLFAVYYFGFLRRLEIGGGPQTSLGVALSDLAIYAFGLPAATPAWIAMGVSFVLPVLALIVLWRRGARALVAFYALTVFVAPVAGLWLGGFPLVFPRYFLISAAVALLAIGAAMTVLWSSGRVARTLCALALAGFLAGNSVHVAKLVRFGRGQYQAAIRYVIEQDGGNRITISSDHDGRNPPLFEHHIPQIPANAALMYLPDQEPTPERPDWVFVHRLDHEIPPAKRLTDPHGERYALAQHFRHAALSGWDWYLYRRQPPAAP